MQQSNSPRVDGFVQTAEATERHTCSTGEARKAVSKSPRGLMNADSSFLQWTQAYNLLYLGGDACQHAL